MPLPHPLFTPWTDPVSGVTSHILSRRIAPFQQSFYFTNPGATHDGRYLWLFCAFPPGGDAYYGRQLAVADLHENTLTHFPETQFSDASPCVDPDTGHVYWIAGNAGLEIWSRGPRPSDTARLINTFPADLAKNRRPLRIATHLTFSADKTRFNFDAQIGNEWFAGDIGSGIGPVPDLPARLWQTFDRCYNHAQMSPTDPDLMLIAQDGWHDASTGEKGDTIDRLWLLRRGQSAKAIFPNDPSNLRGHEWWDAKGNHVWYIHYRTGTHRVNIHTGVDERIWPAGHTHSHSSSDSQYLVGDINPAGDQWKVAFFNIATGKQADIVTAMPPLSFPRGRYHVHPHPQFCASDRYIAYTTNVLGTVDLALIDTAQLIHRTA
jgi:hypothetical protein